MTMSVSPDSPRYITMLPGGGSLVRVTIHSNVRFHSEIPFIPLLGLVHFRVAFLLVGLGGGRLLDQRCIHQRTFAQQQAAFRQIGIDGAEQAFAQIVRFEQSPELQQRGRVRHALPMRSIRAKPRRA